MTSTTYRPPIFVVAALLALTLSGCRTWNVDGASRNATLLPPLTDDLSASELLSAHNANAEKIRSIEAKPTISVDANGEKSPGLSAHLALERPKNLKLMLDSPVGLEADIGSNDGEFWFWIKRNEPKKVFYCRYDENGDSPLNTSMQPDWIIEALGLRSISDEEIDRMTVAPGTNPGESVLSLRQETPQGTSVIRELVISETTKRVREYRLWNADHKQMLADAIVVEYGTFPVGPADSSGQGESAYLPKHLRLNWIPERVMLDIQMNRKLTLNASISESRRAGLFTEPKGFDRIDLAAEAGIPQNGNRARLRESGAQANAANSPTRTRNTMSSPEPKVKLSAPAPINDRSTARTKYDRSQVAVRDPYERIGGIEDVVVPPIPTVDEPRPLQLEAGNGWRGGFSSAIER